MATSTFDIIAEEFRQELDVIGRLLPTGAFADSALRVVTSNAAVLLIAAGFEQFVRETLSSYVAELGRRAKAFGDLPAELPSAAWQRATNLLRNARYGKEDFDPAKIAGIVGQMQKFCLERDHTIDVATLVSYNAHNMKTKELNEVMKRCGISNYSKTVGANPKFISFFGSASPGLAHKSFMNYLDEFYTVRNEVAHALSSKRGTGVVGVGRHIEFFETAVIVIAADMNARCS